MKESPVNPNTVVTIVNKKNSNSNYGNYQVRMMQDKNGKPIGYSAYNPNTGNNILMKLEELSIFKASVENNLGYNIENTPNHQNTAINAAMGLHDDGKTGGALNSWGQYAKSGDIIFDVAGGLGSGIGGGAIKSGIKNSTKTVAKTTKGNIFKKETIQAPSGKTYNFNATNKPTKSNNRKVVVGPNGGKGTYTGKYDKNNNPIIQRESGSYYIKDPKTGKQQTVKSPNEHGNTLGNQPAERYKLVDKKTGKPLKSGETTHGESRYGSGKQKRYTEKELKTCMKMEQNTNK
ncbi:hypothetical protein BSPWISOXPB_4947 [uncultured Gammaproteobacteria bacterium]|nr:hypothetical protein BSPWISOXPB_4947 [uncultured Gammaproteobacteria bacterium]